MANSQQFQDPECQETFTGSRSPSPIESAIADLIRGYGGLILIGVGLIVFSGMGMVRNALDRLSTSNTVGPTIGVPAAKTVNGLPIKWDLNLKRTDFVLASNQETDADLVKLIEEGVTFERLHVRSFGIDSSVSPNSSDMRFFASLDLRSKDIQFRGLHHLKFKARANGFKTLFVQFHDQDEECCHMSDDLDLNRQWKSFSVSLDHSGYWDDNNKFITPGNRVPDCGRFRFIVGDTSNDVSEAGTVDITAVELTED